MSSGPESTGVTRSAFGCITVPFLLIALVPLGWGARSSWQAGDLVRRGDVVDGRVIELRYVESNPTSGRASRGSRVRSESPVVQYTTRTGESRVAIGSVNRGPAPWKVGDVVAVVYDPQRPERADLQSEVGAWRRWFVIWCAVAIAPLAIALAPVVLLLRQRRSRPAAS